MVENTKILDYDRCMARKSHGPSPIFLLIILLIGVGIGYVFFFTDLITLPKASEKKEKTVVNTSVFSEAEEWVPEVVWSKPKSASEQVYYGTVKGTEISGTLVNKDGYIEHFEEPAVLEKQGYKEDLNLSADGPGSSLWGYTKEVGKDQMQIVTFSYTNEDMYESSEGPLTADCPCTLTLSVFVSEPFKPNWK